MAESKKKRGKTDIGGQVGSFSDTGTQEKAESELTDLNQRIGDLARFPEENPNPVFRVGRDGTLLYANAACSLLNLPKCQPGQLLPERYRQLVTRVLDTGLRQVIEVEGKERIFALDFVPVTSAEYVNIYGNDITERKQIEENLRQTRDYLDNLFSYANAPIIVWDPQLKVTRFNHAFERLTGRSADEMLGDKVDVLFPADQRDDILQKINRTTMEGERWEVVEIPIRRVDGSIRTVLWNSATIFEVNGRTPIATIAQGLDITELKKIDKMKDEFIGLVSHELRTPLTVIAGSLESAMSLGISPEDERELIQNAIEGADSLAVILDNMLELSRYQAGRLYLNVGPVDICYLVQRIIEKLKSQGAEQRFTLDCPDNLPKIEADSMKVERILYNLIENAVKYSPGESEIKVLCRKEADFVVTRVIDYGQGIAPEDKKNLFELFERLQKDTHTVRGLGLGLVVCKRLVEAQDGWIKVKSELKKGSTFTFALPIQRADT